MRLGALMVAVLLCVNAFGVNVLTWDTNLIGSPVTIYRAEKIGEGSGESFTLPRELPRGTIVFVTGQGTLATTTNFITETNYITFTNFVTTTTVTTTTNLTTITRTNTITKTNWITKTNFVTITNVVGPGKPPKR